MKKVTAFLLFSVFILTGCDSENQNHIYGHWKNIDSSCNVLCSFSIQKHENAYSDSIVMFDEGPFYKAASGPLISDEKNKNRYLVRGSNGDFLLVLKNNKLYGADNSIYEKTDDK